MTGNQGNNTGNKDTSGSNKDNKGTSSQTTQNTGNQTNEDHAKKNTTSQDTGNQSGSQDTGKKNTGNQNTSDQNTSDQNTGDQNTGSQDTDDQAGVGDANLSREELLERERDSRDYLYGTAHTGYIMDPSSSNGYDISEIPEDALGYYYSDFDEDGEDELLVLDQTGERFVRLNMYEVEDQTVVQADSVLAECDAYNDGSVKEFTVSEGVPAFADAFVYQCGGETRIGFEFAASGIHATGTSHDILSYRYNGSSFELVDYSHNAGSTIAEDVVNDAAYAAEYTADLAKLGVGAMTPQDVASYWNCDTHIIDYMQDVHEIFRAETDFDGDASTLYSNWESGGKARMAFSTIRFWSDGDLFEGDGSLYKDPSTVETKEATDRTMTGTTAATTTMMTAAIPAVGIPAATTLTMTAGMTMKTTMTKTSKIGPTTKRTGKTTGTKMRKNGTTTRSTMTKTKKSGMTMRSTTTMKMKSTTMTMSGTMRKISGTYRTSTFKGNSYESFYFWG